MKIGLLGTRGIPNRYGGFEEFADNVSRIWAKNGHKVYVYCDTTLKEEKFNIPGVERIFISTKRYRFLKQIFYDFKSTSHSLSLNLDIIYHAGYATSVLPNLFFRNKLKSKLIYNMDGLEWKRSKFNIFTRILIKFFELLAIKNSLGLVSDNIGIQKYIKETYKVDSCLIEYGVDRFHCRKTYDKYPKDYDLVIARFEPENHIKEIIYYYTKNKRQTLILVANKDTQLHKELRSILESCENIIFNGPIYDKDELDFLRINCRYYIHGHSVGGTNPSLLEAMVSGCHIISHYNEFNYDVISEHGHYWSNMIELENLITSEPVRPTTKCSQIDYCSSRFSWDKIADKHIVFFNKLLN